MFSFNVPSRNFIYEDVAKKTSGESLDFRGIPLILGEFLCVLGYYNRNGFNGGVETRIPFKHAHAFNCVLNKTVFYTLREIT